MRRRIQLANTLSGGVDINNYLTMRAAENGLTASLSVSDCFYCVNGSGNWIYLPAGTQTEAVNKGDTLSFKAENLQPTANVGIGTFTLTKYVDLLGNVMSMLFGDNAANNLSLVGYNYAFCRLFYQGKVFTISENFVPATTLSASCYVDMFRGCGYLTQAPKLPATTLSNWCYAGMFMYNTRLSQAPELPATTLMTGCYNYMFQGCSALTTAPTLPALIVPNSSYNGMFRDCTNLNYIKALFTTTPTSSNTGGWVGSVASSGTFVKNKDATWSVSGESGIPDGWTIETE